MQAVEGCGLRFALSDRGEKPSRSNTLKHAICALARVEREKGAVMSGHVWSLKGLDQVEPGGGDGQPESPNEFDQGPPGRR